MSGELWIYRLERRGVRDVLPSLLERGLERGWRALVRGSDPERLRELDAHLWTYRADSFLPHGTDADPRCAEQPVLLSAGGENLNGAALLVALDGASVDDRHAFARAVVVFSADDGEAQAAARTLWREAKAAGETPTFWRETAEGGFARVVS